MKILVIGTGKMGQAIKSLPNTNHQITLTENPLLNNEQFDLLIDVSHPDNLSNIYTYLKSNPLPLVMATTGQSEQDYKIIEKIATFSPVVISSNFAPGVVMLKVMLKSLNQMKDNIIIDIHHTSKKDIPSGTALSLQNITKGEITSIRAKDEVGTHIVEFLLEDECLTLTHRAYSRKVFAKGIIDAGEKIVGQNIGLYRVEQLWMI